MHAASALPAGRRPPALATTPDFGHPLGVVGTSPHSLSRAAGLSYSVLSSIPVPVSSRRKPRPPSTNTRPHSALRRVEYRLNLYVTLHETRLV